MLSSWCNAWLQTIQNHHFNICSIHISWAKSITCLYCFTINTLHTLFFSKNQNVPQQRPSFTIVEQYQNKSRKNNLRHPINKYLNQVSTSLNTRSVFIPSVAYCLSIPHIHCFKLPYLRAPFHSVPLPTPHSVCNSLHYAPSQHLEYASYRPRSSPECPLHADRAPLIVPSPSRRTRPTSRRRCTERTPLTDGWRWTPHARYCYHRLRCRNRNRLQSSPCRTTACTSRTEPLPIIVKATVTKGPRSPSRKLRTFLTPRRLSSSCTKTNPIASPLISYTPSRSTTTLLPPSVEKHSSLALRSPAPNAASLFVACVTLKSGDQTVRWVVCVVTEFWAYMNVFLLFRIV